MTETLLMTAAILIAGAEPASAPTGALLGWTSQDRVVARARELVEAGRLAEAEALLQSESRPEDQKAAQARREMAEIIRRIRVEYSLTHDALLAKLKKTIPEVTSEELTRWRKPGQMRYRVIDGEIRYLRREPSHLFRFCEQAKRRVEAHSPGSTPAAADARSKGKLVKHLEEIVAAAAQSDDPEVMPVRHRVTFKLTVPPNHPRAQKGSLVRCWLPFPQEYRQQKDVKLIRTSPAEHTVAPNAVDGSPMEGAPQRTVYLERRIDDPSRPVVFEEEFEYTSYAYYPRLNADEAGELSPGFDRTYLAERPPHIVFTPEIRAAVEQVVGAERNPLEKLRKIYRYLDGKLRWCPEEEYPIIPCFSMKVFTTGQGDCGLQSTLLITMCRLAGVPARWQSGFETKPWGWNMHDWAEVYIEPWGWLPVDVTYGLQASEKADVREFYIGHQDSYRLIVNLDYGSPLVPAKSDARSEPADFQRGEVEIDGQNLYFNEWNYDIKFHWQPLGKNEG